MSTVVFDIDGCLANFIGPAVAKGYELAGVKAPENWVQTHWDDYGGMDKHQIINLWKWIIENPEFWYSLPSLLTEEEEKGICQLIFDGHKVYFATNRRLPKAELYTTLWLECNIGLSGPVVITKRKGEFCRVVDADYYIDDKSENVDCAIWMTDGKTKAYVIDRETNKGALGPHSSKARRVRRISQFLEDIKNGR